MINDCGIALLLTLNKNTISVLIEKVCYDERITLSHLNNIVQNITQSSDHCQRLVNVSLQKRHRLRWSQVDYWDRALPKEGGVITACTRFDAAGTYRVVVTEQSGEKHVKPKKLIHTFDSAYLTCSE